MVSRARVRRGRGEERRCVYKGGFRDEQGGGGGKDWYMGRAGPATMASRACRLEMEWRGPINRCRQEEGQWKRCEKCTGVKGNGGTCHNDKPGHCVAQKGGGCSRGRVIAGG